MMRLAMVVVAVAAALAADAADETGALKQISNQMHDAWCTGVNTEKGACMKHALVKEAEEGLEDGKIADMHAVIDEKFPIEDSQLSEMHKWFCARKESVEAAAGSLLRTFCNGSLSVRNVGGRRYEAWRAA